MAFLHFANLDAHAPDRALRAVFHGLGDIYRYLDATLKFMKSETAVLRLAWRKGIRPEPQASEEPQPRGKSTPADSECWVELIEPLDRPNEPDGTFRFFLDEQQDRVYERVDRPPRPGSRDMRTTFEFSEDYAIQILDRDPRTNQLRLERWPVQKELLLRPQTYVIQKQIEAIRRLQDAPRREHRALVNLFQSARRAAWPVPQPVRLAEEDWRVLRPPAGQRPRPGTDEQRGFVEKALATPDFALLEGPPGSGKTTTICELILQLLHQGQRVLLCASTHVAVDNVLEKLMDEENPYRNEVIPVRIGDRRNISETVRPYQLEEFRRAERSRLVQYLRAVPQRQPSQELLFQALQRQGNETIDRLILDSANVICGTTIGILQHPDIKQRRADTPLFDVLIVDEASKTTFQEFLVPALLAKRWILVGDPRQLSPYVEEAAVAVNIDACLPDPVLRRACLDVFLSVERPRDGAVLISSNDEDEKDLYWSQAAARGVEILDVDEGEQEPEALSLAAASIVLGTPAALARYEAMLPLDLVVMRGETKGMASAVRRRNALKRRWKEREDLTWGGEVGWRLTREYERRLLNRPAVEEEEHGGQLAEAAPVEDEGTPVSRLPPRVEQLLPAQELTDVGKVRKAIDQIRRVALPSILESLQKGFERWPGQREGTALTDGLPREALQSRHTLLTWQHRMHPECSRFSRQEIYRGTAMRDPEDMAKRREWQDPLYAHRMLWVDVRGEPDERNRNVMEAETVLRDLQRFQTWARTHPRPEGKPWEIALLTFYRGQERELRERMRRHTGQHGEHRHFRLSDKGRTLAKVELCTVDRFQGHEADLVLLSFVMTRRTGFLDSPNRLNVALTRGRYQTLLVGHREFFKSGRHRSALLRVLAESVPSNLEFPE